MDKKAQLSKMQSLPLSRKVEETIERVKIYSEYFEGDTYVSFSGGKDSTVLLDIIRKIYPKVPAVFIDTGLEFPEIKAFVKTIDNVVVLKPKTPFNKVVEKYGYPVVSKENAQKIHEIRNTKSDKLRSKRLYGDSKKNGKLPEKWKFLIDSDFKISSQCCNILKKSPIKKYEKITGRAPIVGTMASDSRLRETAYLKKGCNSFDTKRPMSNPMSFWRESDIWEYIKTNNIPYSKIYDMGYDRTGCMFCMFGVHLEKHPNRFQKMQRTHPKYHKYCIEKLGIGKILNTINVSFSEME